MVKSVSETTAQSSDTLTYTIDVAVTGNASSGVVVTDTLPANVSFVGFLSSPAGTASQYTASTSQLSWTLPVLSPGEYQLSYQTKVADFLAGGTLIVNGARLTYPSGGPLTSAVTVTVEGQYTVKIGVYNGAGELVKEILVEQFSQPIENISLQSSNVITTLHGPGSKIEIYYQGYLIGTWDGSGANGDPVSNGEYHIKIDNVDAYGVDRSTTQPAVVSRSLYKSTILIYNEAGEVVRHLYAYVDDAGQAGISGVKLSSTVIAPSASPQSGTPAQVSLVLSNGTTVVWDGKSDAGRIVNSGQYFVEVHSRDGQGGDTVVTAQVAVLDSQAGRGVGTVQAQPNLVQSGAVGTTFESNSAMSLTLRAKVYTTAGELVWGGEGQPGTRTLYWPMDGVASGLYIAEVELLNAQGQRVGIQTVKIVALH
jgi:uncharacterized repeat protein (TIGR01451 family)